MPLKFLTQPSHTSSKIQYTNLKIVELYSFSEQAWVMPLYFYAETSFTKMCKRGYFGVRICANTVRIRSCPITDVCGRSVSSLSSSNASNVKYSVLSWTKNFSAKGRSDVASYTVRPIERFVDSENQNTKSTFIKHVQLTTLEWRVSVRQYP